MRRKRPATAARLWVLIVASTAPATPVAGGRTGTEDEQRVEHEIQQHCSEDDVHRNSYFPDAPQHRLNHHETEDEHQPDERDAHELHGERQDFWLDAQQAQYAAVPSRSPTSNMTELSATMRRVCAATWLTIGQLCAPKY